MLYLGIDQHARQLMISLRDGSGDVLQARQVSTRPEKIQAFLTKLTKERLRDDELLFAVVEAFGFHLHDPWFVNKIDRKSSAFPPLIAARNLAGFSVLVSATFSFAIPCQMACESLMIFDLSHKNSPGWTEHPPRLKNHFSNKRP